jgi:hypothetical protein
MPDAPRELDRLERWMQAVVTHPGGVAEGLASDVARAQFALPPPQLERVILPSRKLSAIERLEIYHRAYFARLLEVLRAEYSVLCRALGKELFDAFAAGFLQTHPPESYTLGDLGRRFPGFLASIKPGVNQAGAPDWPEFMVDLARLEQAVNEVFDGPGNEGLPALSAQTLCGLTAERWQQSCLLLSPHVRLLQLDFPVNDYFTALLRDQPHPLPRPRPTYVVVSRNHYKVARRECQQPAYLLLMALAAGQTVGQSIEAAARGCTWNDDRFASALEAWFEEFIAAGYFSGICFASGGSGR